MKKPLTPEQKQQRLKRFCWTAQDINVVEPIKPKSPPENKPKK